jgi:hypothetical protein
LSSNLYGIYIAQRGVQPYQAARPKVAKIFFYFRYKKSQHTDYWPSWGEMGASTAQAFDVFLLFTCVGKTQT